MVCADLGSVCCGSLGGIVHLAALLLPGRDILTRRTFNLLILARSRITGSLRAGLQNGGQTS